MKKLSYSLFTILLALTAIFFAVRLAPGDPVERILGPEASDLDVARYRIQLGLDLPLIQQYGRFLKELFSGEMGRSFFKKESVSKLLLNHVPPTFTLAIIAISFSTVLGIVGGLFSGIYKSRTLDKSLRVLSLLALSFPIFSLAPLLVLFFSIKLNLLPVSEWGGFLHVILPVATLVIPLASIVIRVARNKYLEEEGAPWVQVLRSKGMKERGIHFRLLKVCLPTIFNVVAIQLSVVLAGTMITETIFDIPGIGSLLFEAIQNRDYPVIQGVIVVSTVIYMAVYFLVDFLNEYLDPRMRNTVR